MSYWLAKVSRNGKSGLIGTDDESRAYIDALNDGECREFEEVEARDGLEHRSYWLMLTKIAQSLQLVPIDRLGKNPVLMPIFDKDSAHDAMKLATGLYTVCPVAGIDYAVRIPKSISFKKMKPAAWQAWFPKALAMARLWATDIRDTCAQEDVLKIIERWEMELEQRKPGDSRRKAA